MATMPSPPPDCHAPQAVLFDLDGTLTRPYFDFEAIKREIGLPTVPYTPILESLEQMSPPQRQRAEVILQRCEAEAAESSELQADAMETLDALRAAGLPIGLITRNSRTSVDVVMRKHALSFDVIHTREDGPIKPSPEPVLCVCRKLEVEAARSWFVGDFLFDLQSGNAAGAVSVLMIGDDPLPPFADQARHVIRRLTELLPLLGIESGGQRTTP